MSGQDQRRRVVPVSSHLHLEMLEPRLLLSSTLPGLPNVIAPSDDPTAPAGFDIFTPSVDAQLTPVTGAPVLGEWTRLAGPDDSIVISGDQLSDFGGSDAGKDTRFLVYGQTTSSNGALLDGLIQRLDGDTAVVTLDAALPNDSAYMIWSENADGVSYAGMVNTAEAWWVGPDEAQAGDMVSLYGQNLSHDHGEVTSWIYIQPSSGAGQWATVTDANPYRVQFVVPETLANGDYEIWVHNGHGGDYGWSKSPEALTITDGPDWAGGTTYNVKDHGVKGDGSTDDSAALNSLIYSKRNLSGSGPIHTLYLPAGTYMISESLGHAVNLRIHGAGMGQTIIKAKSGFTDSFMTYQGHHSGVEFKDLTLDNNGQGLAGVMKMRSSENLRLTNVRIEGKGSNTIDLNGANRVFINNCEIVGKQVYLGTANQVHFDSVDFYGTNDVGTLVYSWGGEEISLSNCTAQDQDNTVSDGWARGRFFTGTCLWGTQGNVYLGENITTEMTIRPEYTSWNEGEQFMWEGTIVGYEGNPTSATATTMTFGAGAGANAEQMAVIVDGKGLGQFRRVVAFDEATRTVTVDKPWNVIPDSTSEISFMMVPTNIAMYDNTLDFKDRAYTSEQHIAAAGIQAYEGALNFIADKNTITDSRAAISVWSHSMGGAGDNVAAYSHLYVNNTIDDTRFGIEIQRGSTDVGYPSMNRIFRDNTITDAVEYGLRFRLNSDKTNPSPYAMVFEHNSITNVPDAVFKRNDDGSMANTLFYGNTFNRGTATHSGSVAMEFNDGIDPVLRDNTFIGFQTTYAGNATIGPVLELPQRYMDMQAQTGGGSDTTSLTIWNSGSQSLSWTASESTSWLSLSATSGTVANQSSASTITLTANPSGLSVGDYTGDVTINANGQTLKARVFFSVVAGTGNSAPVAVADSYSVAEDGGLNINATNGVLKNDTDADSDPLTAVLVSNVSDGTLSLLSNGSFTYTPDENFYGTDSFTYKANDGTTDGNTTTVTITVNSVNDAPQAVADSYNVTEDGSLTINAASGVLANDTDAENDTLTASLVSDVSDGTLSLSSNGGFTYTPDANFAGTDSFTYRPNDGTANGNTVTVTLNVSAVNDAPTATADSYNVSEDSTLTVNAASGVLSNDTDVDDDSLTASLVSDVSNGTLNLSSDGSFTYTPNTGFSGTDSFTYRPNDGTVNGNTVSVSISVSGTNAAPVAVADSYSATENSTLDVSSGSGVLANDTDADSDTLTATLVSDVSDGTLSLSSNGSFTYTPDANFTGTDSFTYKPNDGTVDGNTTTVTITVNASASGYLPGDNMALSGTATASSEHNASLGASKAIDGDGVTRWSALSGQTSNQWLEIDLGAVMQFDTVLMGEQGGKVTSYDVQYHNGSGWTTVASGTYIALQKTETFDTVEAQRVRIYINTATGAPSLYEFEVFNSNLGYGGTATASSQDSAGTTAAKAIDGDSATRWAAASGQTSNQWLEVDFGRSTTFNQVVLAENTAQITSYDLEYHNGSSWVDIETGTGIGTSGKTFQFSDITAQKVRLYVNSANAAPNIKEFEIRQTTPVVASDADYNFGQIVNASSQHLPNAPERAVDDNASTYWMAAFGTSTGEWMEIDYGQSRTIDKVILRENGTKVTGYSIQAWVSGAWSTVMTGTTIGAERSHTFTPVVTEHLRFTCTSINGSMVSLKDFEAYNTGAVNSAPVAVADSYSVNEDGNLDISAANGVLDNDTDADSDPLTAILVTDVVNGTLSLASDGSFTYMPGANFVGTDSFTYKPNDGTADGNTATVTITVNGVNDAPVAVEDNYSVAEDGSLVVNAADGVLDNDQDVEGDALTASLVSDVSNGTLSLSSNGSFTYTPDANFNGTDSFTYKANDGTVDGNTVTVNINVTAVNDAPTAMADSYSVEENDTLTVSASGVLGNDSDVDNDPLTAVLVSDVSSGTLNLSSNGSFTYTPDTDFTGTDSFAYKTNDGTVDGNTVTVTITVTEASGYEPGANMALLGTASASSQHSATYSSDKVIDESDSTRWAAQFGQTSNQWLEIDFGSSMQFNKVVMKEQGNKTTDYDLQYYNGSSWVDIVSGTAIGLKKTHAFDMVEAQEVRVYINSATGAPSLYEFEVYNDNLAYGATATASTNHDSNTTADKAIDGNDATRWAALYGQTSNQYLEVDFGASKTFNQIVIAESAAKITSYDLEYHNGSSWVDIETGTAIGTTGKEFRFTAITAQKVRLYVNTATGAPDIKEFEVRNATPAISYGGDLNYGQITNASSQHQTNSPDLAVDNSASTYWQAAFGTSTGEWMEVDYGQDRTLDKIVLKENGTKVSSYRVQAWVSGAWSTVVNGTTIGSSQTHTFTAVTTQRLRFIVDGMSGNMASLYTFEAFYTGSNMATNMATSASSVNAGNVSANAVDGSSSTSWSAAFGSGADEWLEIDFGTNVDFDRVVLSENNARISGFRVQAYVSGSWTTVYTGTTIGTSATTINFTEVSASKIRLYVDSVSSAMVGIKEFEVYNI